MIIAARRRRPSPGFTLLEMLVVMAIIAALAVVALPALNISKSSGRRNAVSALLGAIEQARAQAIKDGVATYVVFPDKLPSPAAPPSQQRYGFCSYAIFEDDPVASGTVKQITAWKILPTGLSIRTGSLSYLANNIPFSFTPIGPAVTGSFPYLKFTPNGEVDPVSTPSAPNSTTTIQFNVFEGSVDANAIEHATNKANKDDGLAVSRLTGRAERR